MSEASCKMHYGLVPIFTLHGSGEVVGADVGIPVVGAEVGNSGVATLDTHVVPPHDVEQHVLVLSGICTTLFLMTFMKQKLITLRIIEPLTV